MANLKTKNTNDSVEEFLNSIEDDQKREDSFEVANIMSEITEYEAKMWGNSIIGFDSYHYVYESGREGDWFVTGFSPRKNALTLYIMSGFDNYDKLLNKLGKYKTGKSCLYIKRLDDIDRNILKQLIKESVEFVKKNMDKG